MTIDQYEPRQVRSQRTLERIFQSSTELLSEKSYDELSIAEIASHAKISVGGFYARFQNKEALLAALLARLAEETHEAFADAEARNWSDQPLSVLLHHIVTTNAELYEKYRGALTVVFLKTRVLEDETGKGERRNYNAEVVRRLESLLLVKRKDIIHAKPKPAVRAAIGCMTAMLRDAIVFRDIGYYPKGAHKNEIVKTITSILHHFLAATPK